MIRTVTALLCAVVLYSGPVVSGPLQVSNRAATIDEIGYLPESGDAPATNPPALAWLNEAGATSWTIQISRDPAFGTVEVSVDSWPYLLYTHTEPLSPGDHYWRYRYQGDQGEVSSWSTVRSFTVVPAAVKFPRPSAQWLKTNVPAQHPRMFTRPENLAALRQDAETTNSNFAALIRQADAYSSAPIMMEPPPWTDNKWNAGEWGHYLRQAGSAANVMENLAFAWLLTGTESYGLQAKEHLLAYAGWNPLGTSSMKVNDEVGMPMLYAMSRAYDWIYPLLDDSQRVQVREHMKARGTETYNHLRKKPYEQYAYNSHNGRMWHHLGEAALAFYGEIPEAETWLNYAMTIYYGWYPAWGRGDGGWAEGIHYWSSYNVRITWWLDLMQESLGLPAADKPFYSNVGNFPLYICPPGHPLAGFGDFSERPPAARSLAEPMDAFALMKNNPAWKWYADSTGAELEGRFISYIRGRRAQPTAQPPQDLPLLKVFPEGGVATFNSDLTSAAQNIHLAMRSSPFGNVSHSHNDQNAIVLSAYGQPLLVNTGTRDFYGSPFCKQYYWLTQSHNSVLFDGQGQQRGRNFTGEFVAHGEETGQLAFVVGDATTAYPGLVDLYRRWVVCIPDAGFLLVDEVKTSATEMSLLFHGRSEFKFKEPRKSGEMEFTFGDIDSSLPIGADFSLHNGGVDLVGQFYNLPKPTDEVTFTQADKYPIPLGNNKVPLFDEWHLEAKVPLTGDKQEVQRVMTLLLINKKDKKKSSGWKSDSFAGGLGGSDDELQFFYKGESGGKKTEFRVDLDFKNLSAKRVRE